MTDGGHPQEYPDGSPCPECGHAMTVETIGVTTGGRPRILWQTCDGCKLGWGPYTGYDRLDGVAQ